MNRLRFFAFVTTACVLFVARQTAAQAPNELMNPGFETDAVMGQDPLFGPTGWTAQGNGPANTASAPNEPVRTGIGSLQLVGGGGFGVPLAQQTLPASPGQLWDLQGYMLAKDPLAATANTRAVLKIVFDDGAADLDIPAANALIGTLDAAPFFGVLGTPQLTSALPVNTWQFAHAQAIAPPGTVNVRLFCILVDEMPATAYFDDIQALLGGDFNVDMAVTSTDLPIWKTAFGLTSAGDADGNGTSDGADFIIWQRALTSGAAKPATGTVPEPAAIALALFGACLVARRRLSPAE